MAELLYVNLAVFDAHKRALVLVVSAVVWS